MVSKKIHKQLDILEELLMLTPAEQLRNELKILKKEFTLKIIK